MRGPRPALLPDGKVECPHCRRLFDDQAAAYGHQSQCQMRLGRRAAALVPFYSPTPRARATPLEADTPAIEGTPTPPDADQPAFAGNRPSGTAQSGAVASARSWEAAPAAPYVPQPRRDVIPHRPTLMEHFSDPKVVLIGLAIVGLAYFLGRASAVGNEKATAEAGHAMDSLGRKAASKIADKALTRALKGIGL